MNRLKPIILGTLLATVSIASFSANANASESRFPQAHSQPNYVAFKYNPDVRNDRRERELRERRQREVRLRRERELRLRRQQEARYQRQRILRSRY